MAERPYFFIKDNKVRTGRADFQWVSGFSVSQKQKSIASFHEAISRMRKHPLEVSTKSTSELGRSLSAFNLKLDGYYLENIFQSGKVFSGGGPYIDLLDVPPKDAKRDERLRSSGRLIRFTYDGTDWPLEPKTVFYDYIYYCAVKERMTPEKLKELSGYDAFTDIEFNPNKSINTQARSIAITLLIYQLYGELPDIRPEDFITSHKAIC